MKLVIAIVQDEDTPTLTDALIAAGHRFTKVSTTGSFLRTGNTSLLIGVDDAQVASVMAILRRTCRRRTQVAVPYSPALEPGLLYMPENFEVEVGGAVVFVIDVARFERLDHTIELLECAIGIVGARLIVPEREENHAMGSVSLTDRVNREDIVALASRLIATPSTSGAERAVMDYVVRWCRENDLSYEVLALDAERPNVVISVNGAHGGPTLVMNGHLDTVPVSDAASWHNGPFDPTVSPDGRRLYGRGASDMKSSVAVMLSTLRLFKDVPLRGRLQAHVVSDEELGGKFGARYLLAQIKAGKLPRPDYCLIGEKSDLKVRNAERGLLAVNVTCLGRASHTAAARATGINAIAKAAKAVLALEKDIDRHHPAVGKPVISINTIHAGVAHNVVPGECTFSIDRRLVPGETRESAIAEIVAAFDAIAADDADFRYRLEIDPLGDHIPANITDESSPLVQAMQQSVRDVTGVEPEYFVAWAGATDGRFYRLAGVDTVGFGPGGENAHGANEAVFIDDLVVQAKVYADTVSRLLS